MILQVREGHEIIIFIADPKGLTLPETNSSPFPRGLFSGTMLLSSRRLFPVVYFRPFQKEKSSSNHSFPRSQLAVSFQGGSFHKKSPWSFWLGVTGGRLVGWWDVRWAQKPVNPLRLSNLRSILSTATNGGDVVRWRGRRFFCETVGKCLE